MNYRQEQGSSSLLMVLMLFALGSLMLDGISRQLRAQRFEIAGEVQFIKNDTAARSALAWGERQNWPQQSTWQCLSEQSHAWRACLYQTEKGEALLAAAGAGSSQALPLTLWRWGMLQEGKLVASAHGWLDFCPLMDKDLCDLPR